jgi:hypothetical protein
MKIQLAIAILLLLLLAIAARAGQTTNVIYAAPVTNQSSTCPCSFSRIQIASYTKSPWGWTASNSASCRAFVTSTNKICIEITRADGMTWKGTNAATFTPGTVYPVRFGLYFNKSVGTNPFPLTIVNFKP